MIQETNGLLKEKKKLNEKQKQRKKHISFKEILPAK